MKNYKIKKAGLDDLLEIKRISEETFVETFSAENTKEDIESYLKENLSLEKVASEMENLASVFYCVKYNGEITAYMKLNYDEAQTERGHSNSLEIQRIYVLNEYKNNSIGKHLIRRAVEVGKSRQLAYIWLGVWEKNVSAIKFYEKQGFVTYDKHVFKLGDDEQIDYLMKLDL
ncbi:MAG: GNAT family N-acetyltransferase [Alkalibacterium sp.]|uniref:GNAT family N-acetyltransferase n=1 Tax=Alkalibacterium sp. TaxID=1872447 RepID=UPI0039707D0F